MDIQPIAIDLAHISFTSPVIYKLFNTILEMKKFIPLMSPPLNNLCKHVIIVLPYSSIFNKQEEDWSYISYYYYWQDIKVKTVFDKSTLQYLYYKYHNWKDWTGIKPYIIITNTTNNGLPLQDIIETFKEFDISPTRLAFINELSDKFDKEIVEKIVKEIEEEIKND